VAFEVVAFVDACRDAARESQPQLAVRDLLERVTANPVEVEAALASPPVAGITPWHVAADLTVLHVVWPPAMALFPHDHRMWAAIGVYGGQEDNAFFRRGDDDRIVSSGGRELRARDVLLLGDDAIHAVTNPQPRALTAAIHVYGGDFFATPRRAWTPDTLTEHPYDNDEVARTFRAAEEAWRAAAPSNPEDPLRRQ
jgi:predicted metal-dependent enzyme (double-stranded beta helix superfamily)